jgi:hypothetical protein
VNDGRGSGVLSLDISTLCQAMGRKSQACHGKDKSSQAAALSWSEMSSSVTEIKKKGGIRS